MADEQDERRDQAASDRVDDHRGDEQGRQGAALRDGHG